MATSGSRWQIVAALAAVYLIWGSTYLIIRIGVQELPPALFASSRFLLGGVLMLAYALARGARLPYTRPQWALIALTAVLMLVGGNGLVTWSEQWLESNQAALLVATSALWMTGLGALGPQGEKPGALALAGLALGFVGVGILVSSGLSLRAAPWFAYFAISLSPLFWAAGSVLSRRRPLALNSVMVAAMQSLIAGLILLAIGFGAGETGRWHWSATGVGAILYLAVLGSCLGYGAYIWLVHQITPTQLGTYAYVNPAVAVLLGWWILDEHLNSSQIAGTLVILLGVLLATLSPRQK